MADWAVMWLSLVFGNFVLWNICFLLRALSCVKMDFVLLFAWNQRGRSRPPVSGHKRWACTSTTISLDLVSSDEHYRMVLCFSRSIVVSVDWSIHNISFNWVWMSLFKWGWGHTIVTMALKLQTWPLVHVVYTWTLRENTIEFSTEVQIRKAATESTLKASLRELHMLITTLVCSFHPHNASVFLMAVVTWGWPCPYS